MNQFFSTVPFELLESPPVYHAKLRAVISLLQLGGGTMDTLLVSDVARLSGEGGKPVTPATVRWWADTGKLKAIRSVGGTRLFSRSHVEAFLSNRLKKKAGQ